jgi:hypothetical protein
MKIACRVVAIAALIGILATFALIQQYGSLMNYAVDVSGEAQSGFLLSSPFFAFLATTTFALSFASGIVGMVMAGQRRQPLWFAILLAAVVIETYAGVAIIMIPQLFFAVGSAPILSGIVYDPLLRLEIVNNVIAPLFAPLTALIYSLRVQGSQQSPANARPSGEEAGLGGLEYSRLDDMHAG